MPGYSKSLRAAAAALIGLLLATPAEFLADVWYSHAHGARIAWIVVLNCGPYAQFAACLFVLSFVASHRRSVLVGAGSVVALAASLAWWLIIRRWSGSEELWRQVFDPNGGTPAIWGPGMIRRGLWHYAVFSPCIGVLAGAFAGELVWRWRQNDPRIFQAPLGPAPSELGFIWTSVLTYLVLFRIVQGVYIGVVSNGQAWDLMLLQLLTWCAVLACTLIASLWLWRHAPTSRRQALARARWMSIAIVAAASVLPLMLGLIWVSAIVVGTSILTVNVVGFLWAAVVGDLRWRYVELRQRNGVEGA